jgi:hypothetical protein
MRKQAYGPEVEQAVDAEFSGSTRSATVVVARGVQPGVQAGLDCPVREVRRQPIVRAQLGTAARLAPSKQAPRLAFRRARHQSATFRPALISSAWF